MRLQNYEFQFINESEWVPDVQMEVKIESKWIPQVSSETPWTPLGRFGDHVGSFGELLGCSVELLGSSLGALGVSLGALEDDFGSILGAFLLPRLDMLSFLFFALSVLFSLLFCL